MKPLILNPPIKDYIWGGTKLREQFGKKSDLERLAESWELSCHKDGMSIIANGEYSGRSLKDFLNENPSAIGTKCSKFDDFPILIKLIDARDNLSVQVHPDNEYAMRIEGEYGKTEMWYIVDCEENASLIYGFKEQISKDDFQKAIEENTLLDKVNSVPVKKGDVFFIEAGALHAIGKGILIAEIQQNSNTTYRVYDYGRVGNDGKPRELHVEKALDVTKLTPADSYNKPITESLNGWSRTQLAKCEYFTVYNGNIETSADLNADDNSFNHILVLDGAAVIEAQNEKIDIHKGDSIFIPAGLGEYKICGKCSIIITKID
ncbi:MAG TPA: class I mannose-6-phosphate isomerase [Ruminococcus sp.]|nr:class I mannose-6-phosphate isomerase [Ruminococcus sp.]